MKKKENAIKTTVRNVGRCFVAASGLCATTCEKSESLVISTFDSVEIMLQNFVEDFDVPTKKK